MSANQVIRFAVMIDSPVLKNWQLKTIERLLENPNNKLVVFIENANKSNYTASKLSLGFRFLERQLRKSYLFQSDSIELRFKNFERIKLEPKKQGIAQLIVKDDLEKLKKLKLDFILRFGFGILKGEILNLPNYGVWSFHHGNPESFRGGPPSFWEFLKSKNTNGLILQRLNEQLDAGEILRKGNIAIWKHSYIEHCNRLFNYGIDFPSWVCKSIRSNSGKLKSEPIIKKGPIYKTPSNWKVFLFYLRLIKGKIRFHYIQLFQGEIWNIGVANSIKRVGNRNEIKDIVWAAETEKGVYKADPFWGENHKIYYESYDYRKLKGDINCIQFENNNWSKESIFRSDKTHYSYPFYLEENKRKYLLPENFQAGKLSLYEIEDGEITSSKTLIEEDWIDPTLIEHNEKWWLFVTPQEQSNEELHLYFSDSLTGTYKAHPLNPVKIDISSARPGGTPFFDVNGKLIRPSQNSAKTYGASIVLNEIEVLNERQFKESKQDEIFPDSNSKYKHALHTFTRKGNQILIDGKRLAFIAPSFWSQLKRKTKRIFKA